jgi:hypothetical protein
MIVVLSPPADQLDGIRVTTGEFLDGVPRVARAQHLHGDVRVLFDQLEQTLKLFPPNLHTAPVTGQRVLSEHENVCRARMDPPFRMRIW